MKFLELLCLSESRVIWLRRFFIAVAAAMAIIAAVSLVAGLPKEIVFLGAHGLILSLIGVLINSVALGSFRNGRTDEQYHRRRPGQEDQGAGREG